MLIFFKKELCVREFLATRYLWKGDSAPCGQRRRRRHGGRDSAAPPPPRLIWKRKKKLFLYRRNQQPPSCRGSELGFRSNSGFNAEFEHPFRDMTPPFPRKHHRNVASETFCAKKLELDQRSSGKKAPYM